MDPDIRTFRELLGDPLELPWEVGVDEQGINSRNRRRACRL